MTLSSKKYMSNFTSSTTNRGVEAKEIEITNTCLLEREPTSSSAPAIPPRAPSPPPPPPTPPQHCNPDDSSSYIQVEVRRNRGGGGGHRPRGSRLPLSSSPAQPAGAATLPHRHHCLEADDGGGGGGEPEREERVRRTDRSDGAELQLAAVDVPAALLQDIPWRNGGGGARAAAEGDRGGIGSFAAEDCQQDSCKSEKEHGGSVWRKLSGYAAAADCHGTPPDDEFSGPERVEVYYFERSAGEYLATGGGARETHVERWARRAGRRGRRALAELLAVPRVLLGAPLAVMLGVQRTVLQLVRTGVQGAVGAWADYALKPALALLFNAGLHPPLIFASNVSRALRDALRPLWAALSDALEPVARLLSSVRLVHVHIERHCSCTRDV